MLDSILSTLDPPCACRGVFKEVPRGLGRLLLPGIEGHRSPVAGLGWVFGRHDLLRFLDDVLMGRLNLCKLDRLVLGRALWLTLALQTVALCVYVILR